MVTPVSDLDSVLEVCSEVKTSFASFVNRYLPQVSTIPLHQGLEFVPTWKALPTAKVLQSVLYNRLKIPWEEVRSIRSCFLSLPYEIAGWTSLVQFVHTRG